MANRGQEQTHFPMIFESSLGDNSYVRMVFELFTRVPNALTMTMLGWTEAAMVAGARDVDVSPSITVFFYSTFMEDTWDSLEISVLSQSRRKIGEPKEENVTLGPAARDGEIVLGYLEPKIYGK